MEDNNILDLSTEAKLVENIDELLAILPEQSHYDETDGELFICNIQFNMCVRHETLIKMVQSVSKKVACLRFEDCEFSDNVFIGSSVKEEILDVGNLKFVESIFFEDIVFLGDDLNPKGIGFFDVTMYNNIDITDTSVENLKSLALSVNSLKSEEVSFWIAKIESGVMMTSFATSDDGNYYYMEEEFIGTLNA